MMERWTDRCVDVCRQQADVKPTNQFAGAERGGQNLEGRPSHTEERYNLEHIIACCLRIYPNRRKFLYSLYYAL